MKRRKFLEFFLIRPKNGKNIYFLICKRIGFKKHKKIIYSIISIKFKRPNFLMKIYKKIIY